MAIIDDLISCWPFDDDFRDAHGSNHWTANGSPSLVSGTVKNAAKFVSASGQDLSLTHNATFPAGAVSLTVCAWVKLAAKTASSPVISKWGAGGTRQWNLLYEPTVDRFRFATSANASTVIITDETLLGSPAIDTWYFVAGGYDYAAGQQWIAVNAGTPNTSAQAGGIAAVTTTVRMGYRDDTGARSDFAIDEVLLFGRSLSADDLRWLYNGGRGRSYPFTSPLLALHTHGLYCGSRT